jgi:hypothetical protein
LDDHQTTAHSQRLYVLKELKAAVIEAILDANSKSEQQLDAAHVVHQNAQDEVTRKSKILDRKINEMQSTTAISVIYSNNKKTVPRFSKLLLSEFWKVLWRDPLQIVIELRDAYLVLLAFSAGP